jgi:hypothetical protein
MSVKESAERLRRLMIEKCPALEARFNPGLSPEECKALAAQYDVVLTQELIDFFGVINGFDDIYAMPQWQIWLYNGRWFDTLKDSLESHKQFFHDTMTKEEWLEIYPEFFESGEHTIPPLRFMGEDSSYFYAADLEGENRTLWSHFKGTGLSVEHQNLEAFLYMLCSKIESGNLFYDEESESWEQIDE